MPSRESNPGLPYSKPTYFYLSYAALFELRLTLFELRCTLLELRRTLFELRLGEETYMAGEI